MNPPKRRHVVALELHPFQFSTLSHARLYLGTAMPFGGCRGDPYKHRIIVDNLVVRFKSEL